jgi:hypothetical protein
MAAIMLGITLWATAIMFGKIMPPTSISSIFHDSFFTSDAVKRYLVLLPFAVIGLGIAFWTSGRALAASRGHRINAWIALAGATISFSAICWLTLGPLFLTEFPRRLSQAESDALIATTRLIFFGLIFGVLMSFGSAIARLILRDPSYTEPS